MDRLTFQNCELNLEILSGSSSINFQTLLHLTLANCRAINDRSIYDLITLPILPQLLSLNLNNTSVTSKGLAVLAGSELMSSLESLKIYKLKKTMEDFQYFLAIKSDVLKVLHFDDMGLQNLESFNKLKIHRTFPKLRTLKFKSVAEIQRISVNFNNLASFYLS